MLHRKKVLIIFNADTSEESEDLEMLQEIREEEAIRGSIEEVAYKIGMILKEKGRSPVDYLKIRNAEQLKNYLESVPHPDLIFNLCEPIYSCFTHERDIAKLLEKNKIPFTGNSAKALAMASDKNHCNNLLKECGLPYIDSILFSNLSQFENWQKKNPSVDFPLIVKLNLEDSSLGIEQNSIVNNLDELTKRVRSMFRKYKQPILAQQYIDGREIHVAYHGHNPVDILGVSELDFSELSSGKHAIYTYAAKWDLESDDYCKTYMCESKIEDDVYKVLRDISLKIINLFDFRGYGRFDFRLSKENIPYLIDANPNCNISDNSSFAVLAERINLNYEEMILDLCVKTVSKKKNSSKSSSPDSILESFRQVYG